MLRIFRNFVSIFLIALFSFFVLSKTVFFVAQASALEESYLFLERMQTNVETEIIFMFTPTSDFLLGTELEIVFEEDDFGAWCEENVSLAVEGVDSSAVDITGWEIDFALPGEMTASCITGDVATSDKIVISNIGQLSSGSSYGVRILKNSGLTTSPVTGRKNIVVTLNDGENFNTQSLAFTLIASDSILVSASVADVSTISCGISHTSRSFGTLPKDGSVRTVQHTVSSTTSLTKGLYWAVYGQGDGINAGLWKSAPPASLIPSTGTTTINLGQTHGFGLSASASRGVVPSDFAHTGNIFGAINSGSQQARILFYDEEPYTGSLAITVTLGARAGAGTEVGPHTETLTYICGGLY